MKNLLKTIMLSVGLLSGGVPAAFGEGDASVAMSDSVAAEVPKLTMYQYEYQLIPMLLGQMGVSHEFMDNLSDARYLNEFILPMMGAACDFDMSTVSVQRMKRGDKDIIVYTFPTPKWIPDAKYGAIVNMGDKYRYFTLEKSLDGYWVLGESECSVQNLSHRNYGDVPESETPEKFVDLIESKGLLK